MNSIIVLMFVESQRVHMYRTPVRYVTKTWSVVLLNKKIHILRSQVYCKLRVFHPVVPIYQFNIYCPPYTTQWCKVKIMHQLIQLHVSTPWGHLQAYKIWYHTRYICCYYLRDPVVYNTLVINYGILKMLLKYG